MACLHLDATGSLVSSFDRLGLLKSLTSYAYIYRTDPLASLQVVPPTPVDYCEVISYLALQLLGSS